MPSNIIIIIKYDYKTDIKQYIITILSFENMLTILSYYLLVVFYAHHKT
jgi:hypothetical protein